MANKQIFSSELLSLNPRKVNTREEVLNTLDRQAVEIGAKNARVLQILNGDRPTGIKELDDFMSTSDTVIGTILDKTRRGGLVEAYEEIDRNFALGAEVSVRRPLDKERWLKRANRSLARIGEPPITRIEMEQLNQKTLEGYLAQLKGEITYLDKKNSARLSEQIDDENAEDLLSEDEIASIGRQRDMVSSSNIPAPRSKPVPSPRQKPASRTDLEDAQLPRSKPINTSPRRKPAKDHSFLRSEPLYSFNPFDLEHPNLEQQAQLVEENPAKAKQLIRAAGRDPKLFGFA